MRPFALTLLAATALVGCFRSFGTDDPPPVVRGGDAGPGRDLGPVVVDPPPTGCGDLDGSPAAPECEALCNEVCAVFAECGGDLEPCLEGCYDAYRCPGETPGHDAAICSSSAVEFSCDGVCAWVPTFGGFSRTGPVCERPDDPPPSIACAERDYCDCDGGCEPLIDLTTGCVCPCDDPFNCTGDLCDCGCGGARYLGCAPVGRCPDIEVRCEAATERAALDDGGCPVCLPR